MVKNSGGPYKKKTLLEDTINGTVKEKEKKQEKKESTSKYDGLSTASDFSKITPKKTTEKKTTTKSTTPAPFKPRTLLETTTRENKGSNRQNTNNRFESRFTPRTVKNAGKGVDSISVVSRLNSLDKSDIERDKKAIENAKKNPDSLYYQQNYKKRFYDIEERGYEEGVTRDLNELYSGLKEVKIRKNVTGELTEDETYVVKGMQDYEANSKHDAHRIDEVNEYGLAPVQFMSEQELNNYMYIRGKYDAILADLYYLNTDAYDKYEKEKRSASANKGFYEAVKKNPAIGYIAIPTLTVASGIMGLMAGAEQTINKVAGRNAVNIIDEEAAFKTDALGIAEQGITDSTDNPALKKLHEAGIEIVEEIGEGMLPGGEKVWGSGAGIARKYTELAQYGVDLSSTEAYISAMLTGGTSAVDLKFTKSGGEKIGKALTKGMRGGTLKTIIGNTAGSILSGMGAQVTRAVVDNIADATLLNDKGRYATIYKQYTEDGLTADEANKKAILDAYVTPVVNSAVMGGIFGGTASVPNTISTAVDFTRRGKELKRNNYSAIPRDIVKGMTERQALALRTELDGGVENAVIRQGSVYDKNSVAARNAKLLDKKVKAGKKLTNSEIGAQDILNRAEEYKFAMKSDAARRLTGVKTSYDGKLADDLEGSYSRGEIKLSTNLQDDYNSTFDHEGVHATQDGAIDVYSIYAQRIRENAQYSAMRNRIRGEYKDAKRTVSEETLDSEVATEFMRYAMPKTAEDYERLIRRVEGNPTLHDRMYNAIRDLRIKMYAKDGKVFKDKATGFEIEYSELLQMEKTLENALMGLRGAEFKGKTDGDVVFSLKNKNITINNRIPYTTVKNYISVIKNDYTALGQLKTNVKNLKRGTYHNKATGYSADVNADTIRKAIHPTNNKFNQFSDKYIQNLNAMVKLPELFENAVYIDSKNPQKNKIQNPSYKEYHHFVAPLFMDNAEYRAIITAREKTNSNTLYVLRVEVLPIKQRHTLSAAQHNNAVGSQWLSVPSDISISDLVNGVKIKNYDTNTYDTYSDADIHFRLKTNQDMNVFGRNVIDDLHAYNRKRGYGSAFDVLSSGMLPDFIRQSWRLFESGEIADGRKVLYLGGEEIAKAVRKKKGETDHMIATDFVEHFTNLYKQARTIKAYEGRLGISEKDIIETSVDIPRYVAELTTKNYANTDLMLTLHIERAIRSGYRLLKNGSDDFAIREALRPAAETILNESKTKDGNHLKFESESEYNAAVNKLTDDIIENYHLEQTAKNVTDSEVKKADTQKYGKDIEGLFRGIGLGITEGSVKKLGGSVRQMLDFVLDEDYNVTDFNGKLDEVIGEELTRLKVSPTDKAEIANTIICELREIAMSKIGKRKLELRGIMQAEIEAGRDTSEAWQAAHDELMVLYVREANLTGVYFPHGNPGNDYALRNPAKKLHKINVGSKEEFDSIVKERMGEMTYRISHNKDTADYGMRYVAMNGTMESFTYLSSKQKWNENDMGIAAALVGEFGALGEPQLEADVLILAAQKATEAGKLSQAFSLMYRLTPAGNIAFLNKTENNRIQFELERHPQRAEIEKQIEARQTKDAEERKSADKALYETDAEYKRDSDNKTRLQLDLEAAAKGEEEAKRKIAEYEELHRKNKLDKEFLAFMSGAGWRVENRRRQKLLEDGARDTMREIGMSEDDIEMYLTAVDVSPEKHRAFIRTLRDYMAQSESFLLRKEGEYQKWLVNEGKCSREAKKLRREIRQIAIRQRSVQNDYIVRAYRVNDDGELDPKGRHIVTDNPKASKWEIKKALGEDASHEAAEHYKSHVDMLYDKLGIKHTDSETFTLMRELANALPDIEDADELMDIIMITSRYRKTATGRRMEKMRSMMYRGLDKLGEKHRTGFTPVGETLDLRTKSMSETEGEPDNKMLKWLLGFGDKETNNIRRLLRKHFGNDTEQLKKIATSQMFGMIADTENVSTGRKAKNIMFQSQLIHPPTIKRNVLSNIAESARMNIVNNAAAAIDWLATRKGGQRVVGFENPFAGHKEGKARSEKAYLETALNVDILNNDHSRLGTPSKKRTFKRGPLAMGERILGYALGATDEYFKGAIYEQVRSGLEHFETRDIEDAVRRIDKRTDLKPKDKKRLKDSETEKIKKRYDEYAQQQMLYRTFQNESIIAQVSVGIRDALNIIGTGKELPDTNRSSIELKGRKLTHDFGLGDFINPYPLVSGNILDRVIDVTPVGAVKALVKCGKLAKEVYANNKDVKALESVDKKHVRDGMSDEERYKILANKTLKNIPKVSEERVRDIETKLSTNIDNASELSKTDRKKLFIKIGHEFGVYKDYTNEDVEISFEFTKNGMRESEEKQKGNYRAFAKMFSCFDDVIDRAIGIEVHNRNGEGYKVDTSLKEMYVLVSAFEDGENIIPVKLEIKEFNDRTNKLYVAIALEGIKKNEVVKQENTNNSVTQALARSNISISQLLKNVNPKDKDFIKYIPKQFLAKDNKVDRLPLPDSVLNAKRDALLSVANALISPVGWWLGAQLFKCGILLGGEPAEDEEDYERAKMNTQWTINWGAFERLVKGGGVTEPQKDDLIMPIGFLGPAAGVMTFGAEAFGDDTDEPVIDKILSSTGESVYAEFMAMSSVSGMRRYINDWKYADTPQEGMAAIAADAAMSFMPSTVRAIGNALDDHNRDPYRADSQLGVIGGKFLSKMPVTELRENVPLRIDLWGEAEVHTLGKGKLVDIMNNALSPAIFSRYETNVVTDELDKLTAKNKDLLKEILPKTPYRNNTGEFENGQPYSFKLDDENYEKYANLLGMTTYKAMHTLVTSDDYKHLTDTQKTTALAEISKESAELVKEIWVSHQQGVSDSSMQKRIDKYVASNEAKASKVVKTDNALKYIKLDGVKVEDVIDAGYRVPYTEEEKGEQIAYNYSMISKIRNGTYYDKSSRKYSSSLTAEQRQQLINSFVRSSEDLASGIEQKWISITGEFKNLTDKEKGIVIDQIGYNIDKVRLPDNVGSLVDTSVETEPVDLTYPFVPRNSNIIDTGWRADEYDREQAEEKKAEAAEDEDAKPESKSVEEYLSEYKGSGGGNSGYSRNYSKKSYNNSYGGGYSSGSSYRFTPSVQPVQKNTYRFTPRFGGSGSRFGKKF
ncbi:MAG: hypothetical protein IJC09_06160 [Clostridia bacterium]|nr:hypothetical protein [Clostridia bacterium]